MSDTIGDTVQPARYTGADGRETIDTIRDVLGTFGFLAFCAGTALKYRDRAGKKDGAPAQEDHAKAAWYEAMIAHVHGGGPDPRAKRPGFQPYRRQEPTGDARWSGWDFMEALKDSATVGVSPIALEELDELAGWADVKTHAQDIRRPIAKVIGNVTSRFLALVDENKSLKADNAAVRKANVELADQNTYVRQENAELRATIDKIASIVAPLFGKTSPPGGWADHPDDVILAVQTLASLTPPFTMMQALATAVREGSADGGPWRVALGLNPPDKASGLYSQGDTLPGDVIVAAIEELERRAEAFERADAAREALSDVILAGLRGAQ